MDALSICDKSREVIDKVSQVDVWSALQEAHRDDVAYLRKKVPAVSCTVEDNKQGRLMRGSPPGAP